MGSYGCTWSRRPGSRPTWRPCPRTGATSAAAEVSAGGGGDAAGPANVRANLNRNRNRRFHAWIDSIESGRKPCLHFKHSLLPHVPWQYLPSGKQYRRTARDPVPGLSSEAYRDQGQLDSLYQRHLLQTGFADRVLGQLLRKLQQRGRLRRRADRGRRRPRAGLRPGQARPPQAHARERRSDRARSRCSSSRPGRRGGGQRRLCGDGGHPAHDLRRARLRPAGEGGWPPASSHGGAGRNTLRILERGTFKPIRIPAADFEREKAPPAEEAAPVRHGCRRARPPLSHRPQPGAASAGRAGTWAGRCAGGPRIRRGVRASGPALRDGARARGRPGARQRSRLAPRRGDRRERPRSWPCRAASRSPPARGAGGGDGAGVLLPPGPQPRPGARGAEPNRIARSSGGAGEEEVEARAPA